MGIFHISSQPASVIISQVSVRNARKVGMEEAHQLGAEDERKRAEKEVQKLTDKFVVEVDKIKQAKEKEIMQG